MYSPTTRLLTVLELLQSYPERSGKELSERLEVDSRTVRRYITMLQDMGIPIEAERGRYGGYRLRPGYKLPPLMFTEEEAIALALGLLLTRRLGVAGTAVEGAIAKIERVMPLPLKGRVQAIEDSLVMEIPQSKAQPPASETIATLSLAIYQEQQALLHYQSFAGRQTERIIDPYGLVYRAGFWYTAGYCHLRQGLRTFRLDRIVDVSLQEGRFERPANFNLVQHVEQSIANTPGTWPIEVLLYTTEEEAREKIPPVLANLEPVDEGVIMRCYIHQLDWFAHLLAGLDWSFKIYQPPELKKALQRLAAKVQHLVETV